MITSASQARTGLIDRTLQVFAAMNGAERAAVFSCSGNGLVLAASRSVDQALLDGVKSLWAASQGALQQGRVASAEALPVRLFPLIQADRLVGCVALDALDAKLCTPLYREQVLGILARAISRSDEGPLVAVAETILNETPARDHAREQLLVLMDQQGWSLARVARYLGITRRTLSLRLGRYGIARRS
jgi:hypothetical protein